MLAYLMFPGNCAEALAFYARCLDGKVASSMTVGESPMASQMPEEQQRKIMHARFEAMNLVFMASDALRDQPFDGYKGFALSVPAKTADEGRKLFDALAEGGTVTMPYEATFWAFGFGMLTDRFGVPWMVNCDKPDPTVA